MKALVSSNVGKFVTELRPLIDVRIIILLVQFWLLSGHLLGNSCPLG